MEEKIINDCRPFISVMGGGGKTTFLVEFGNYLRQKGKKVLLTTTTKLAYPGVERYGEDYFFTDLPSLLSSSAEKGSVTLFAHDDEAKRKLFYPGEEEIVLAWEKYDVVLCEADGSRHLPVKIHTSRDPVILPITTAVVSLVGIWCMGKRTGEVAFGEDCDTVVDASYLQTYIDSPQGPMKGMEEGMKNILLFNGGDSMKEEEESVIRSLVIPSPAEAYIVSERKGVMYNAL